MDRAGVRLPEGRLVEFLTPVGVVHEAINSADSLFDDMRRPPETRVPNKAYGLAGLRGHLTVRANHLNAELIVATGPVGSTFVGIFDASGEGLAGYSAGVDVEFDQAQGVIKLSERSDPHLWNHIGNAMRVRRRPAAQVDKPSDDTDRRSTTSGAGSSPPIRPATIVVLVPPGTDVKSKECHSVVVNNVGGHFQGRFGPKDQWQHARIVGAQGARVLAANGDIGLHGSGTLSLHASAGSEVNVDGNWERTRLHIWGRNTVVRSTCALGRVTGLMTNGRLYLPSEQAPSNDRPEGSRPPTDLNMSAAPPSGIYVGDTRIRPGVVPSLGL